MKEEKGIIEAINNLAEKVEYNTKAIRYLADCFGFTGDKLNPGGGKLRVEKPAPADEDPMVKETKNYSFDQIKTKVNEFARKNGKDAALELVKKFAGSFDIKEVKPEQYRELMREAA